jgi:spindle assembly abnormal protein 6
VQTAALVELLEQHKSRIRDLETAVRQLEGRCADQREVAAGHEQRAREAQAEVIKGNQVIDKLSVGVWAMKPKPFGLHVFVS